MCDIQYIVDMKKNEKDEIQKIVENLNQELRRGSLVLGVLSQLKVPQYGYSLVELLSQKGLEVEPGTLYPLLRRLESQQLLESEWETSQNKPRKYYQLSSRGLVVLDSLVNEWQLLTKQMIAVLKED